jgi:S1-C subfamily serine protease
LQSGDLILAIDGHPAGSFHDVEMATQNPRAHLTILRNGHEVELDLDTTVVSGSDVDRILLWSGAALQAPHRAVAAQRGIAPEGVLVAYFSYGSPATRYGLWAGLRIIEVDGRPTPDIDTFLRVVRDRPEGASMRLKVMSLNNQSEVITLKPDQAYWPTVDLRKTPTGWDRKVVE